MQQITLKKFFVFEIIASDLVSLNCLYEEQDGFHRRPLCSQAVPWFCISIIEVFSNSISLVVIDESDKESVMEISTVLGHFYHIACRSILWNGTF